MSQRLLRFAAALLVLLGTLVAAAIPSVAAESPELPAPTGGLSIGTRSLYLKDTSRPDP
jgi:hypothetical protein